jgi:hypothetical protein
MKRSYRYQENGVARRTRCTSFIAPRPNPVRPAGPAVSRGFPLKRRRRRVFGTKALRCVVFPLVSYSENVPARANRA